MGTVREPEKVKLIAGLISNDTRLFDKAKTALEKLFKTKVDFESPVIDFVHTEYYNKEMGDGLKRKFLSFRKKLALENIHKVKLLTNKIEKRFLKNGRRAINIDPGYVDMSKLVLFSTKDYIHRIHVGDGIFAEVTLFYKDNVFNAWPWTYPDYRTGDYISAFETVRELSKTDRKT